MMQAGGPLVQAFDIIGRGHANPAMQDLILAVKNDSKAARAGRGAPKKHPLYFDTCSATWCARASRRRARDRPRQIATYKERTSRSRAASGRPCFYPVARDRSGVVVTRSS